MGIAQETPDAAPLFKIRLAPNPENVVASELIGEWIVDKKLQTRLCDRSDYRSNGSIIFRKSKESEQRIIAFLNKAFGKVLENEPDAETRENLEAMQKIYVAGEFEFAGKKQDFALTSVYGTPRILFHDREQDLESENVMLARDFDGDNDLLFLGGDFNNQSFGAFKRAKKKLDAEK